MSSDNEFKEKVRESLSWQWTTFPYYRNLCKEKGCGLEDLKKAVDDGEYYRLPGVASLAFKRSRGLINELNDFSVEGKFQVSSSTSGDPSYLYTQTPELEKILDNYVATFGLKGVSKAIAFSPSIRILEGLSKKAAAMGKKSIARLKFALDAAKIHYSELLFTLDIDMLRSLVSMVFLKKPTLKKLPQGALEDMLRESERKGEKLAVGGVVLLMVPYLACLKEGQFSFHDRIHVVFSGGGWSGSKGSMRGDKVNKPELIRNISSVFGIDEKYHATNFKDIYGFTENPSNHEGFWNKDINDYMYQPWHNSRVYIVDPETEKPLKSGKGLFKVISPYHNGKPSCANVSVVQYDTVEIFGVADDLSVTRFSHISRCQSAGVEGCALKAEAISGS